MHGVTVKFGYRSVCFYKELLKLHPRKNVLMYKGHRTNGKVKLSAKGPQATEVRVDWIRQASLPSVTNYASISLLRPRLTVSQKTFQITFRPIYLQFSIISSILLISILVTCCSKFDLYLNIWTKCNSLTQQFTDVSTTIGTWATCFDFYRVIFRPSKNNDPINKVVKYTVGFPMLTQQLV